MLYNKIQSYSVPCLSFTLSPPFSSLKFELSLPVLSSEYLIHHAINKLLSLHRLNCAGAGRSYWLLAEGSCMCTCLVGQFSYSYNFSFGSKPALLRPLLATLQLILQTISLPFPLFLTGNNNNSTNSILQSLEGFFERFLN